MIKDRQIFDLVRKNRELTAEVEKFNEKEREREEERIL